MVSGTTLGILGPGGKNQNSVDSNFCLRFWVVRMLPLSPRTTDAPLLFIYLDIRKFNQKKKKKEKR